MKTAKGRTGKRAGEWAGEGEASMRQVAIAWLTMVASATAAPAAVHGYGRWQPHPRVQGGEPRLISVAGTCASDGEHTSCYFVVCRAGGDFELLVQSPSVWDNVKVAASAGRFATTVIWKDYPRLLDRLGIATAGGRIDLPRQHQEREAPDHAS
jgi:hypothetical protein